MKIGITSRFNYGFFANGLNQNVVLLYEILESIGAEVFFLDFTDEKLEQKFESHKFIDNKKIINWWDFAKQEDKYVDILLCPGVSPNKDIKNIIKKANQNSKICSVHYGNNLISDIHSLYFSSEPKLHSFETERYSDLVLYSPHYSFAKDYMALSKGCEAMEIPYIWDPKFIQEEASDLGVNPEYKPVVRPNIAVVEPCLNISKTNFIPLLIILHLLKESPHVFDEAYIFSNKFREKGLQPSSHLKQKTILNKYPDRVYFDPRQKLAHILAQDNPIILSHQFYNELNYVYLEALHYNFPLIHNSPPFKEAGFYYHEFNISEGANCVISATKSHNDTLEKQKESGQKIIERYSIASNRKKMQQLIEKIHNA
tara:strand:+ start:9029 stop:10138 length:1110 start_codon:yes stop_codon:yes gene_type:complete